MTVIAWDKKTIAADRQISSGSLTTEATKLNMLDSGIVLGRTGTMAHCSIILDWFEKGAKPKDWPFKSKDERFDGALIVAYADCVDVYHGSPFPDAVDDASPYMAWGAGSYVAIGAMAAGATAIEAVEIAIKHDYSCGFGVDHFDLC